MNQLSLINLEKIKTRGPLGSTVYEILKKAITGGEIPPGTWLLEDQLTQTIGTRRTPLRETFDRLQSDGLIDIIPRKGAYTVEIGPEELDELFEAREIIETRFFCRAARNMSEADFLEFQQALIDAEERMNQARGDAGVWDQKRKRYLQVDRAFHDALISACENRYWPKIYHNARDQIEIYGHLVSYVPRWFEIAIQDHYDILDALVEKEYVKARQRMARHGQHIRQSIAEIKQAA